MPRGDRKGPTGMGPMTGRGAGYCGGFNQPGFATAPGGGRGLGRGRGGEGRGRRNRWGQGGGAKGPGASERGMSSADIQVEELELLKEQAAHFERALLDLERRVEALESKAENTSDKSDKA